MGIMVDNLKKGKKGYLLGMLFIVFGVVIFSFKSEGDPVKMIVKSYCSCNKTNIDFQSLINSNEEDDCLTIFLNNISKFRFANEAIVKELNKQCPSSPAAFLLKHPQLYKFEKYKYPRITKSYVAHEKIDLLSYNKNGNKTEFNFNQNLSKEEKDSLSIIYFSRAKEYVSKNNIKKGKKYLIKAFSISSLHNYVKMDVVNYLIELKDFKEAEKLLSRISLPYNEHLLRAKQYFYLGLINVKKDWESLKTAYKYFKKANNQMLVSKSKDLELWSDILNAMGFTSLTGRGLSKYANSDKPFCIQHFDYFKIAYPYFVYALKYNSENNVAKDNIDSIQKIFRELNERIPYVDINKMPDPDTLTTVSLDSIDLIKTNETDSIEYDAKLLPNNYKQILDLLNKYDEVVLVVDLSTSMLDPTGWSEGVSKFEIMSNLSNYLAKSINKHTNLGIISIDNSCDPYDVIFMNYGVAQISRKELINTLQYITPNGATPLNQRLKLTPMLFSNRHNKKSVFLISDGMDVCDEPFDVCYTASYLNDQNIDFSLLSFILETDNDEISRFAYEIYECMVKHSEGSVFKVNEEGEIEKKELDKLKEELKLRLPHMTKSTAWKGFDRLYQFDIKSVLE